MNKEKEKGYQLYTYIYITNLPKYKLIKGGPRKKIEV